jgi:hypothetical protein
MEALQKLRERLPRGEQAREWAGDIRQYLERHAEKVNETVRAELQTLRTELERLSGEMGGTGEVLGRAGRKLGEQLETTARRADLLYSKTLEWAKEHPAARYTGIALLAIGAAYLANRFWTWAAGTKENPTFFRRFLKWTGMISFGWLSYMIINRYGERLEQGQAGRNVEGPRDQRHPPDLEAPELSNRSLLGVPFSLNVGRERLTVEFSRRGKEVVLRVGSKSYRIYTVTNTQEGGKKKTNCSGQMSDAIRRQGGLGFRGGPGGAINVHVQDREVKRVIEGLKAGPQELRLPDVTYYTSPQRNDAPQVAAIRFEAVN